MAQSNNTEENRPEPCEWCGARLCSMVFANDPWCCDNCHKQLARLAGMPQAKCTPQAYAATRGAWNASSGN